MEHCMLLWNATHNILVHLLMHSHARTFRRPCGLLHPADCFHSSIQRIVLKRRAAAH